MTASGQKLSLKWLYRKSRKWLGGDENQAAGVQEKD
jgi:hypothetical protein